MTRFNPDDPKWTAYVLGELNITDREAVEKELESCEEARNLVEELRFAADLTKSELKDQAPLTSLTFEQRQTIRAAAAVERPRRWFGTRTMVWAACLATASIALLVAAVSSVVLHQRRLAPATAVESTIAENRTTPLDSERQSEPPSLSVAKKLKSSSPPEADRVLAPAAPVAATAGAPVPPPPPPAATPAQDVISAQEVRKEAAFPVPVLNEARAGAGAGGGVSSDQKAQAVIPLDKGPVVAGAFGGRALVAATATAGRIFGTISDASAARIPGVDINATNVQTGAVATAVTNEAGAYILDGLQTGTYQVKAELPGFQTIVSTGVQVAAGSPVERDLTMQVAQMAQSVEVTVAADTILASSATVGRGGAAGKDTIRLRDLAVVPPASSFAPGIPIGALGGVLRDSSSPANAASENAFLKTDQNPVSRFLADMNTASYDNVRRYLNQNQMPPPDAVRIEAMVNYFTYNYPRPSGSNPFGASIEAGPAPWNPQHRLVRIGIKAKDADERQPSGNIVATDMKLEIEFNPTVVREYRLIDDAQFSKNDAKDAGSVKTGQTFTALYEIVPKTLKNASNQTLMVKVSYKDPNGIDSRQLVFPFVDRGQTFDRTSIDFRFAAAVASFGMVLRNSQFKGTASLDSTLAIAEHSLGPDRNGQRHEFVKLVERARQLTAKRP